MSLNQTHRQSETGKLRLHKETLRDLVAPGAQAAQVKGGIANSRFINGQYFPCQRTK